MQSSRPVTFALLPAAAFIMAFAPIVVRAQNPVAKPPAGTRLPGPRTVVASQDADGRIRVVWNAIPWATSYLVVRSAPPQPARPIAPNPTDTVFLDSDVTVGTTYYYVVAAIGEDGQTGLKVGSSPVRATRSVASSGGSSGSPSVLNAPTNVVATLSASGDGVTLIWQYGGRPGLLFFIEQRVASDPKGGWTERLRTRIATSQLNPGGGASMNYRGLEGARLIWRVSAIDSATGAQSPATESNELTLTGAGAVGSSGASGGTSSGTVAVTMGASVSVRAGSTASIAAAVGGPSTVRWMSLDDAIATVDASGTATGRAPGRAQVVGLGRGSNGSVNVTVVVVTVTP